MPEAQTPATVPTSARSGWGAVNPHADAVHQVFFRVFLATSAVVGVAAVAGVRVPSIWSWLYAIHVVVAVLTMLAALARRLPLQNVVACGLALSLTMGMGLLIVGHEWAAPSEPSTTHSPTGSTDGVHGRFKGAQALGATTGSHDEGIGSVIRELDWRAWPVPLLWTALLLGSRQTAKVLLQPWRRQRHYGWWLLAAATGLAWVAVLVSTPFKDRVAGWWSWTSGAWSWYGVPAFWLGLVLFLIVGLLLLAGAWLVPKRRTGRPADFEPVWVWGGLVTWFALGDLREGLWVAAGLGIAAVALVTPLAWRGSRMPVIPAAGPGGSG